MINGKFNKAECEEHLMRALKYIYDKLMKGLVFKLQAIQNKKESNYYIIPTGYQYLVVDFSPEGGRFEIRDLEVDE